MSMRLSHLLSKRKKPFRFFPHSMLPIYSITHLTYYYSSVSSQNLDIVNKLVSIFTQPQPFSLASTTQLATFGPRLTTNVVEATLKTFKNWELALRFFNWASIQDGFRHNSYTYNAMASLLSGARQNAALKALCIDLINSRCFFSAGALGFFLRCLGSQGMGTEANELFDQVEKLGLCVPNEYTYNSLLEAISKSGLIEIMTMRMNEMKDNGWKFDKYTLTSVLQCYCSAGMFEKATQVFRKIHELGWVDSYVFTILVLSLTKSGEVDKAIDLIAKMDDFNNVCLNEKTFYVLIHGFVKESRLDDAFGLLLKMQSLGFVPGISIYAVLIERLCQKEDVTRALQLYSQMKEMGIRPDYNLLVVLVSSLACVRQIMCLLKEAKGYLNKKSMTALCNAALSSLVNDGSIDNACRILKMMVTKNEDDGGDPEVVNFPPLDASSFRIVIDGLCQKGKLDMALHLSDDMDQIGCKRNLPIYNNLINALCETNKVEKCHELLEDMKANGLLPSQFTHNAIFGYYCRSEDVVGATYMLREMRTHGHQPWIKHNALLVKKLFKSRRVTEACNFLATMVREGFVPDMIAYSVAIDGLLKVGEVDQAWKMFKEICASGRWPDVVTYNTIITGLCKAKQVSEAQEIYLEMIGKGFIPSLITYNLLMDAYCKENDIGRAIGLFSTMDAKRRNPNVVTYTTLIDGLCNAGRSDEALGFWNEMVRKGNGCSPNEIAYMALIHGLCKCRKPDAGLIYFQQMEEKHMSSDSYVYIALIEAFVSKSNAPMALGVLRKMIQNERFPEVVDKQWVTLREAVVQLLDDARTSSEIRGLFADGSVPTHLLQ